MSPGSEARDKHLHLNLQPILRVKEGALGPKLAILFGRHRVEGWVLQLAATICIDNLRRVGCSLGGVGDARIVFAGFLRHAGFPFATGPTSSQYATRQNPRRGEKPRRKTR